MSFASQIRVKKKVKKKVRKKKVESEFLKFKPHNYQKKAIKFMLERGAAGLFLDPGLGKTAITLSAIKIFKKKGVVNKTLIIAPLRVVYSVWPEEIKKWKDFEKLTISIVHGSEKKRIEALEADADIYVMNPEGLAWLEKQRSWHFDMLVVDESSKFRNSATARFKCMRRLVKKFTRRYILTGTPAPNGLLNLFGQIYILDQGRSLGAYITQYRQTFFYPSGYGGYDWQIQKDGAERIYSKLRPLILRMEASDYLELPPLITQNIKVKLPEKIKKMYKVLEKDLIAKIDGKEIVAANAAVASQKCRQISNGGIYLDDSKDLKQFVEWLEEHGYDGAITDQKVHSKSTKRKIEELHLEKAEAVADLVDELEGQPALIAYEFKHDLIRLKKVLGKNTPHIGSGVTPAKSNQIIKDWNAGKIPVLLGQPSSMSHGLNMQGAGKAIIFHSLIWDLEAYDQFIKRVWRQGQTERIFLYHIVSDTTTDRAILGALKQKHRTQKALLDAFKDEVKKSG